MVTWHDGPSVVIDEKGREWPIYTAQIDCSVMRHEFYDLGIEPDEAATIVEQMLERVEQEMYEYVPDWVRELRG